MKFIFGSSLRDVFGTGSNLERFEIAARISRQTKSLDIKEKKKNRILQFLQNRENSRTRNSKREEKDEREDENRNDRAETDFALLCVEGQGLRTNVTRSSLKIRTLPQDYHWRPADSFEQKVETRYAVGQIIPSNLLFQAGINSGPGSPVDTGLYRGQRVAPAISPGTFTTYTALQQDPHKSLTATVTRLESSYPRVLPCRSPSLLAFSLSLYFSCHSKG